MNGILINIKFIELMPSAHPQTPTVHFFVFQLQGYLILILAHLLPSLKINSYYPNSNLVSRKALSGGPCTFYGIISICYVQIEALLISLIFVD